MNASDGDSTVKSKVALLLFCVGVAIHLIVGFSVDVDDVDDAAVAAVVARAFTLEGILIRLVECILVPAAPLSTQASRSRERTSL